MLKRLSILVFLFCGCYWSAMPPDLVAPGYSRSSFDGKSFIYVPIRDVMADTGLVAPGMDTLFHPDPLSALFFETIKKKTGIKSISYGERPDSGGLEEVGNFVRPIGRVGRKAYYMARLVDSTRIDSVLTAWPGRWPGNARWSYEPHVFYKPSQAYLSKHNNPDFAIVVNAVKFSAQPHGRIKRPGNEEYCDAKVLSMTGSAAIWDCRNDQPVVLEHFRQTLFLMFDTDKCEFTRRDIKRYVNGAVFNTLYGTPLLD
jgi:hypothetical protein